MIRNSFSRKQEPKPDRSEEFASFKLQPATARMASAADFQRKIAVARIEPKTPQRVQQSIRDSARGEECTVRIVGVCTGDTATTVWSHGPFNDAGKGMGIKGLDLVGCYSCWACHDVVDGRAPRPAGMTREAVMLDWCFGHFRSLLKLKQKGLV